MDSYTDPFLLAKLSHHSSVEPLFSDLHLPPSPRYGGGIMLPFLSRIESKQRRPAFLLSKFFRWDHLILLQPVSGRRDRAQVLLRFRWDWLPAPRSGRAGFQPRGTCSFAAAPAACSRLSPSAMHVHTGTRTCCTRKLAQSAVRSGWRAGRRGQ